MEEKIEPQFVGRVQSVRGQIVSIASGSSYRPELKELLTCPHDGTVRLEAYQYTGTELFCLLLSSPKDVHRNMEIVSTGKQISIPVGKAVLGRAINVYGEPEDGGEALQEGERRSIYPSQLTLPSYISMPPKDIAETGIKALDFFTPVLRGGKLGLVGGAGVGKTVLLTEILRNLNNRYNESVTVFAGIGERIREAHELRESLEENAILERSALVLGAINENAAVRFRTAWAAATLAEYFRDAQKQDVIFFVDNVFRFLQAGSELSTLLGEIPSELGYQPTLQSEIAQFENRLASTGAASITSVQTVYVPADELANPAVGATIPHLDAVALLSRDAAQQGRYPAIDLFRSSSSVIDRAIVGDAHYKAVTGATEILNQYDRLARVVAIVGEEEISAENQRVYQRAQKILNYMTQSFFITEIQSGRKGVVVRREDVVRDVQAILDGKFDLVPAEKFLYIGTAQSVVLT